MHAWARTEYWQLICASKVLSYGLSAYPLLFSHFTKGCTLSWKVQWKNRISWNGYKSFCCCFDLDLIKFSWLIICTDIDDVGVGCAKLLMIPRWMMRQCENSVLVTLEEEILDNLLVLIMLLWVISKNIFSV